MLIVSIAGGAITIGTLFVKVSKVLTVLNKQCPCTDMRALKLKVEKHDEYFSNDHESISKLDDVVLSHDYKFENIDDKIDRIDENVKQLLVAVMNK